MENHDKHPAMLVHRRRPFCAGTPLDRLRQSFFTPNEIFFVRSHGEVPQVDPASFRLIVDGQVRQPLELSLAELAEPTGRFPRRTTSASLQCSGLRRRELAALAPIPGELPWGSDAIGNALWEGFALADLLAAAEPLPEARHVELLGLDSVELPGERTAFGGSLPLDKARGPEVLIADRMNGSPLPAAHGFPLRAVVPGWIGARSVKWLQRITLRETPSENHFQARAYRLFPAAVGPEDVKWEDGIPLGELTVTCLITHPNPEETINARRVPVQGVALAGGGRGIARVEVSSDGGRNWILAELGPQDSPWTWRFWEAAVDLRRGRQEIVARAWDSAAHTQPESAAALWNFKGYMNNSWARVRVLGS